MSQDASSPTIRRPALLFGLGLVVVAVAAMAILSFDRKLARRQDPRTDDAYVGGDVTALSVRVQGYLRELPITDNQAVHAGALIARIEDDDYRARVVQAQAQLAAAQARLQSLEAQLRQLDAQLAQSRSAEAASLARLGSTVPELVRQQRLARTDLGEQRSLDRARDEQRQADAELAESRAMRLERERQAGLLAAQRRGQVALVQAQRASLRLASVELGWTRLLAPFDGTLGVRAVRIGDLLAVGSQVVTLTPLRTVWVDANFTERQITFMQVGQPARLALEAFPAQTLYGHVLALSPTTGGALSALPPDNATGNFTKVVQRVPVRIAIDWNDSPLRGLVRPGMSVVATVRTRIGDAW